jgi:hypothetical protein
MTNPIVYLASPYTHFDEAIRQRRYEVVTQVAAIFIGQGKVVFSPITMTHPIDRILAGSDKTLGSDYWVRFDESFMNFCSEMVVLKLMGWETSTGVNREIKYFVGKGLPISYVKPEDFGIDNILIA